MTQRRFDSQDAFQADAHSEAGAGQLSLALKQSYSPDAQMSPVQIEAVSAAILSRAPGCNMLVFGLGNDSPLWANLNRHGYTLFLENSSDWIKKMTGAHPHLNVALMNYPTTVEASLRNPAEVIRNAVVPDLLQRHWDVILVDAPMGWQPHLPGRALPIIWTSLLAKRSTHVFVDDYERTLEHTFADFLFADRVKKTSVVLERPATLKLNASKMLWIFGLSDEL